MMRLIRNNKMRGMALVFVLLVMSILTAIVADFSYEVYVSTSLLTNWQKLQDISLVAESGINLTSMLIPIVPSSEIPGKVFPIPPIDPFDQGIGVSVIVEMESAKFNVKKMVNKNGERNDVYIPAFKRMLEALELDPIVAEYVADYMDTDPIEGFEDNAKNSRLQSVEELLLVAGIDREVYNILLPHVTIYGNGNININLAEPPVIMALFDGISLDDAEMLVEYRKGSKFTKDNTYIKIGGSFAAINTNIDFKETLKVTHFKVTSTVIDDDGLRREITCVLDRAGKVHYWKEM